MLLQSDNKKWHFASQMYRVQLQDKSIFIIIDFHFTSADDHTEHGRSVKLLLLCSDAVDGWEAGVWRATLGWVDNTVVQTRHQDTPWYHSSAVTTRPVSPTPVHREYNTDDQ